MKKLLYIIILFTILPVWIMAQQEIKISKSEIIENIDSKDYYLHFVKKGESLFEIAKVYKITVNDIFIANVEAESWANMVFDES